MKYFRRKQKAPPELRVCTCHPRDQIREEDGTCYRCAGHVSISLEEIKVPYRDPSRAS